MAHTRTTTAGKVKIGETAWHKDGPVLILVERTARGWKRLRVIVISFDSSRATEHSPLKGVFKIHPLTELLTKNRVSRLLAPYGTKV